MEVKNTLLDKLNDYCLEYVDKYTNLCINNVKVRTPYYINNIGNYFRELMKQKEVPEEFAKKVHEGYKNREISFGWYRGKGTPEQIESATVEIAKKADVDLSDTTEEGIREFMKIFGLGVDCSGFVYNTLDYALSKFNKDATFNDSLAWGDKEKQGVNYAGVFVFQESASENVSLDSLQPLDLIFKYPKTHDHIAIVLNDNDNLIVAQSSLWINPVGVSVGKLSIGNTKPVFELNYLRGQTWEKLYKQGELEFRRLKILM